MSRFMVSGKAKTIIEYGLYILAFAMLFYQLYYTQDRLWEPSRHRIMHLGFAFGVVIIARMLKKGNWPYHTLLLILSTGVTAYFMSAYIYLAEAPIFLPIEATVCGVIVVLLILVVGWWSYGALFPLISIFAILYITFGQYLPGVLRSPDISVSRIISWVGADVTSEWGAYGFILSLTANYLWLFMVFGAILQAFGAMRFIRGVGNLVASKLKSGPAALSIITSSLLGSVTGSTVANVTITGSFTIPLMKSRGYSAENAAAIETAASNGGQILPPVMGITAFIMAGYTGIPYVQITFHAIVPALLYYMILIFYAQFQARKLGMVAMEVKVDRKELLLDAPVFIVPFLVLVYFLVSGFSLMYVIFWTIIAVMVVGTISSYRKKELRLKWREVRETMHTGIKSACEVTMIAALIGIVVGAIELTGLAVTLGVALIKLAGGNLFVLLIFTMLVATLLGMGLPSVAAYVLTAVVLSPVLLEMGVPLIAAHMFPFVFAVFCHLTPPIGMGLIVATKMAQARYWHTAREAMKAAFVAFIIPFFFIYAPAVLLIFGEGPATGAIQLITIILVLLAMSMAFNNEGFSTLRVRERAILGLSAVVNVVYLIAMQDNYLVLIVGVALFVMGGGLNFLRKKREQPASI